MKTVDFKHARGPDKLRVYAIGDVHGRLDLLQEMHRRIQAENEKSPPFDWVVVHLGDYIDRGLQSKGVLDLLVNLQKKTHRMLALAGNHDIGLLEFLDTGDAYGLFARNGGRQTALSYGININFNDPGSVYAGRKALADAIPPSHIQFLRGLRRSMVFGDFFFCHAGIRPGVDLDRQDPDDLIWIRWEFLENTHPHPKIIVHGHTPVSDVEVRANRVNLDTGAYASGRLSAIAIDAENKFFLEASV
ncbi:metallophosphoesterase [Phyllobacterium zundukense]|uniref:Serine/threonine protein phosphatase n=1 Tax=Phyllobacterium zundukense TaxID=1867719 RepID=A0A2N9VRU3_9HYPH|nr:metallophosphoesterase [Phyllobacterium zundukense]ATU92635.1 serine/threonine protein phosphatase [Phyllobacterium zundukense]PIO42211.1 serine/threonine protein phosphatase [Phyllobacterium zundukense]